MRQRSEDPSTDSEKGTVRQENGSVCQLGVQLCGKEELSPHQRRRRSGHRH